MTVRVRFLATFKALFGGPARALDLPEGLRPIVILPVGYPDAEPAPLRRRGVADLVHRR